MQAVEIVIKGQIDRQWSEWLGGLEIIHVQPDRSRLTGAIADHATLYGIISKLQDLGVKLVSINLKEGMNHA